MAQKAVPISQSELATAVVASTVAKNFIEDLAKTEIEKNVPTIYRRWTAIIHGHVAKNYAELSQEIQQGNTRFKFLAEDLSGGIICEEAEFSQVERQLIQVKLRRWHNLTPYEMEHSSSMETISHWHLDSDGDFLVAPDSDTAYSGDVNLRGFLRNGGYLTGPIRVKFITPVAPAISLVVTDKGIWMASAPMTHELFYAYERRIHSRYTYSSQLGIYTCTI